MKIKMVLASLILTIITSNVQSDQITHKFKSPSFSGIGTSAHYLTIENQERSRREEIKDDIEAAIAAAEREARNTTQAKFLRNLESRIYAQIAKQLVDNMFGNDTVSTSGSFEVSGNSITYETIVGGGDDGVDIIRITVVSEDGTTTTLDVPIGTGGF
tara:strand:+ start:918 stop:1391 length:474 start_codon:yes stop_codon:yes gene_type:complete